MGCECIDGRDSSHCYAKLKLVGAKEIISLTVARLLFAEASGLRWSHDTFTADVRSG